MEEKTRTGEVIVDTIELRKEYENRKDSYSRLLKLATLIIDSALLHNDIRIHSMKKRVKDYQSFFEKVERKRYEDPFRQCTDIAGCRIICFFQSQIEEIRNIIEKEFKVLETTNKRSSKKYDQFGYLSLHLLIQIPSNRARYIEFSGLGDFICEIQIRTILQEAWAEIEHHLNYKSTKEERDEELLRKIYSLAGMFEVADSTFEDIHRGFSKLMVRKKRDHAVSALALYQFSKEQFPWYSEEWTKKQERAFIKLSNEVKTINVKSMAIIKNIVKKYSEKLERYEFFHREKNNKQERYFAPVGLIRAALALEYGKKFDLAFGLKGYSAKVKKEISNRKTKVI